MADRGRPFALAILENTGNKYRRRIVRFSEGVIETLAERAPIPNARSVWLRRSLSPFDVSFSWYLNLLRQVTSHLMVHDRLFMFTFTSTPGYVPWCLLDTESTNSSCFPLPLAAIWSAAPLLNITYLFLCYARLFAAAEFMSIYILAFSVLQQHRLAFTINCHGRGDGCKIGFAPSEPRSEHTGTSAAKLLFFHTIS